MPAIKWLIGVGAFITLIVLIEIIGRVVASRSWDLTSRRPGVHDSDLGWVPRPSYHGRFFSGEIVTIDPNGIRQNGNSPPVNGVPPIVAVGDSYTFGDHVSDWETWPAILEDKIDKRVINGGVFGYGIDQSYWRAEKLIHRFNPNHLIFGFTPKDILWSQLSAIWGMGRPYFVLDAGEWIKRTNPSGGCIPRRRWSPSAMLSRIIPIPSAWNSNDCITYNQSVHNLGVAVGCEIARRLKKWTRQGIRVSVLIQYPSDLSAHRTEVARVSDCMRAMGIPVVDMWNVVSDMKKTRPADYAALYNLGHMTARGNELVATMLVPAILR